MGTGPKRDVELDAEVVIERRKEEDAAMPTLVGYKRPRSADGVLDYYPRDVADPRHPSLQFQFRSRWPWGGDEAAPFSWRLINPVGDQRFPIIDLVADRFTEIIPPRAYSGPRGPDPTTETPFVRILRPQVQNTVPQEEEDFNIDKILGNADSIYGTTERFTRIGGSVSPALHQFFIRHLPISNQGKARTLPICVVTNVASHYQLQLRARDIWRPLAYWLQIFDNEKVVQSHTAAIWTFVDRNVDHKNVRLSEANTRLDVYRRFLAGVNQRSEIPYFSANVALSQNGWPSNRDWMVSDERTERVVSERPEGYWWRQFVQRAEDLVGLVPVVGDIYDIGSIAYMSVSGKAPWTGDPVPRAASFIYGAVVLGPISVSALRRLPNFTSGLPKDFLRLSDEALLGELKLALEPEFAMRMAAATTDAGLRDLHLRLMEATSRKISPSSFAKYLSDLLGRGADISTIEKRFDAIQKFMKIDSVFVSPSQLKDPFHSQYQLYLARTGHLATDVSPLEWCLLQRSGASASLLRTELGPNFAAVLRTLAGSTLDAVRPETLRAVIRELRKGAHYDNYKDLCRRTKALWPVVERDHIFEKRFFLNNPNFSESMDMYELSLAVLVPRNPRMAAELRRIDPTVPIEYCHSTKRPLLQRLPDGREGEFPLQAIWDVHIDSYRQLGVKVSPNGNSFGAIVFKDLVENLDYLARDLQQQSAILRQSGRVSEANALERMANYRKRFDPKDRAFRMERFKQPQWWLEADS
jgi:hypothetical protein